MYCTIEERKHQVYLSRSHAGLVHPEAFRVSSCEQGGGLRTCKWFTFAVYIVRHLINERKWIYKPFSMCPCQ